MIDNKKLKKQVADLRKTKDISMDVACKEIGISKATLSRIENGKTPDAITLLKVCNWLGTIANSYLKQGK